MLQNNPDNRRIHAPRLRVAIIAHDDTSRVLLLQHERHHGRYWVLPGGGVDNGETIYEAVEREVMEELGVGCDVGRLVAVGELITPDRHVVDFFLTGKLERTVDFDVRFDEGILAARWFERESLVDLLLLPPEIIPVLQCFSASSTATIRYMGKYRISG